MFDKRVIAWNLEQNGLNLDPSLEIKMLSEEANEFFLATSTVDRLDAVADFYYVADGTLSKMYAMPMEDLDELSWWIEAKEMLSSYITDTKNALVNTLKMELINEYKINDDSFVEIMSQAYDIVINANEQKLCCDKDEDGKTIKPKGFIPPQDSLKKLLKKYT